MWNLLNNPRFSRGTRSLRYRDQILRSCPEVAGSNPAPATNVMSQDIADTRTCGCRFGCCSFRGACGLVVLVGIDDQLSQELAGGGVDDADVEVLDEQEDAGSGVGSPDADVA